MSTITHLTEAKLREMYKRNQKWNAKNIKLIVTVPSKGIAIGVEKITGEGTTVKGNWNKLYPIHAKVLLFVATDLLGKTGKKKIGLGYWSHKEFIGRNDTPAEIDAALKRAEKFAYVLASRVAKGGISKKSIGALI
jgi:hypothetical protein